MANSRSGDIPIGSAMRRIDSGIQHGCPIDLENWPDLSKDNVEQDHTERMANIRPALYILGGLLTPFAVGQLIDMKNEQLPQGLVAGPIVEDRSYHQDAPEMQPSETITSFTGLYKGLRDAARLTMNTLVIPEEYGVVVSRFNQLVDKAREIKPDVGRYKTPKRFLLTGLFTCIEMTIGAQSGISALADNERSATSHESYTGITNRSIKLVTSVAALNIDHINPFRRVTIGHPYPSQPATYADQTPYFNPNMLTFQGDPDAEDARVDYIKSVGKLIDPLTGKRIEDIKTRFPTLTCLALPAGADGNSPIKEFWQHTGALGANAVYPQ